MAKSAAPAQPSILPFVLGIGGAALGGYVLSRWLNACPTGVPGVTACPQCPEIPPVVASALAQYEKQKILVNQLKDIITKFPGGSSLLAAIGV